ncbi:MAG: Co2+/Mg2+ efflux protein ApaG [Alphaproteobacteria bacterium]|nr:Co2+/Mg2+ efflux protein ApaG [Alphaproteobacteria bacterium]
MSRVEATPRPEHASEATTRGVRVRVLPHFLPDQSSPATGLWVHAYQVTIENLGDEAVQLVSRHWVITNGEGEEQHVEGPGVVGEQPVLEPGQTFVYVSGCPLDTPLGAMHGTYQMVTKGGDAFDAVIAPFTLAEPGTLN